MATRTARKPKAIKVEFVVDKDTKNTRRFSEVPEDGQEPVIGTLYVQKTAFGGSLPDSITVTVASA